jgi:hypothetical protein
MLKLNEGSGRLNSFLNLRQTINLNGPVVVAIQVAYGSPAEITLDTALSGTRGPRKTDALLIANG